MWVALGHKNILARNFFVRKFTTQSIQMYSIYFLSYGSVLGNPFYKALKGNKKKTEEESIAFTHCYNLLFVLYQKGNVDP